MKKQVTCNGELLQFVGVPKVLTKPTPEQQQRHKLYESHSGVQVANVAQDQAITLSWLHGRGVPTQLLHDAENSPTLLSLLLQAEMRKVLGESPKRPLFTQTYTVRPQQDDDAPPPPPRILTKPRA